ncbi:hypothetical protein [Terracoccus luteus]|uniref:PI-PLC Y-box domain-containing protein n=1 Tax=Terracoccus luteus TaxID=53356 RepID=A0A839PZY4_9MICO|nr:hypothetical protein [Terracoccus luteus]MBB2987566.1 hypothetical protein [Terracoccus luteus]MCP2173217.1 hypothetical protein [Terracoccus luteus]
MPIVYVHGVAVRDDDPDLARRAKPLGEVPWPTIEAHLREHVAPAVSDDPEGVPVLRVYWGDLGARFAWGGRSLVSRPGNPAGVPAAAVEGVARAQDAVADLAEETTSAPGSGSPASELSASSAGPSAGQADPPASDRIGLRERGIRGLSRTVTALRRPFEDFVPVFIGDVLTYVATRGTADAPGPIVQRVLDGLEVASFAAHSLGEPLVVLTHSMGGQIVYDVLTHFLPRMPELHDVRVDFWCAAASQVGFFEELGLFLESDPDRGPHEGDPSGGLTPMPSEQFLGGWWNVWDHSDLLSFRAAGILDGINDSAFFASGSLATDHNKYLVQPEFYRLFAERVRASLAARER